jgi:hypothetical protein
MCDAQKLVGNYCSSYDGKIRETLHLSLYNNLGQLYYTFLEYHSKSIVVLYYSMNLTKTLAVIKPPIMNRTQQYGNILHLFMFDKLFKYSA